MSSIKLKEDLNNCRINFDRRVLITGLLDEYQISYKEVEKIIQDYLKEQEMKDSIKFEKSYLVHGQEDGETKKEVYKIVEEIKLKNWLNKLKNAEFSLYSVEVAGGAKSAAPVFKPMRIEECIKSKTRQRIETSVTNGIAAISTPKANKKEIQPEKPSVNHVKKETTEEKAVERRELSPAKKKAVNKKPEAKKSISNFFAQSGTAAKKHEEIKDSKTGGSIQPTSSNKVNDFSKKQAEKFKPSSEDIKKSANTSVQLFDDKESEEEASSDEEEKLQALKRDIISSDVEIEDEEEQTVCAKRRRILDSDEEEDPPVKQEKLDIREETKEEAVAETYLDEDGFVITKKTKQKGSPAKSKLPESRKVPPVTIKPSSKETNKPNSSLNIDSKPAAKPTAKTKQVGIMNFFSKK